MLLSILLASSAYADTVPPGALIENAASLQVTAEGLNEIAAMVPALLPADIPIDTIEDGGNEFLGCWDYWIKLTNAWVDMEFVDVTLTPTNGALYFEADVLVQLNEPSDEFRLQTEIVCISGDCDGYVEPFLVTMSSAIALEVVTGDTGAPVLDATIGDINLSYDDLTDAIQLDGCALDILYEIIRLLGFADDLFSLFGIDDMLADLGPELEATIEDAFSSATISEEIDLNGVPLTVDLFPRDVVITTAGVEIIMSGSATAPTADCVAEWDPNASSFTDTPIPGLGEIPLSSHMGILLSDDFANQALYSVWRGGLLCYELSGNDPLPINTSLLGLLAGDAFDEIFPENRDMIIATRPREVITAAYDGGHDVVAEVRDLGLNFYAEVDDRMALALGLALDVDAGIDLPFDGNTGNLGIELALSGDNVSARVVHNELVTGTEAEIEENFAGVFDSLLGSLLGGLTEGLGFALPGFDGVGLTALEASAAGGGDWLGLYASVGEIPYEAAGCDSGGGCGGDSSGCSGGGCASGPSPARVFWLGLLPALLVARRRRVR
ncbi:MAG: hypothetical protein H6741_02650 [Alphaproteobacteria bacterium]|nr:hypothetical protein [Alphaproteobacteria bacterium]MCB9791604.1 hypothetical protein [Alphaproteobacteria bacterium]